MRKGVLGLLSQDAKKMPSLSQKKTPKRLLLLSKKTPKRLLLLSKKTPKKTQKTPIKDEKDTTYSKVKMKTQWTGDITVLNVKRRQTNPDLSSRYCRSLSL